MKVIKTLYGISEASAYWFKIYYIYLINKLSLMDLTYDFCLLYIEANKKSFEIVGLQKKILSYYPIISLPLPKKKS